MELCTAISALLTLQISITMCNDARYNLIFLDYLGDAQGVDLNWEGFWGLNVNLSNTDNCCDGTLLSNWSTANGLYWDTVTQYTNNGTSIIGPATIYPVYYQSIITINSNNSSPSIFISPMEQNNSLFLGWLSLSLVGNDKSICNDLGYDSTGLWLADCTYDDEPECHIYYGCIDSKTNTMKTLSIFPDIFNIATQILYDSGYSGSLYDKKRDLIWYYTPNWNFLDYCIIFSININGTNMKQQTLQLLPFC